jgi:hypothetical protein
MQGTCRIFNRALGAIPMFGGYLAGRGWEQSRWSCIIGGANNSDRGSPELFVPCAFPDFKVQAKLRQPDQHESCAVRVVLGGLFRETAAWRIHGLTTAAIKCIERSKSIPAGHGYSPIRPSQEHRAKSSLVKVSSHRRRGQKLKGQATP